MSVRINERGENVSTIFTKASELLAFSIRTMSNVKNGTVNQLKLADDNGIPKRYLDWIATPIIGLSRDIMHNIYCAEKEKDTARKKDYLCEAGKCINCLQSELTMCFLEFNLKQKKAIEWCNLIDSLKQTFQNWERGIK